MERFNYPNLAAAENEDIRIVYLLECESWGKRMDDEEEMEESRQEAELAKMRSE